MSNNNIREAVQLSIEPLLVECRKQALLEAVDYLEGKADSYGPETEWGIAGMTYATAAKELRRMAGGGENE